MTSASRGLRVVLSVAFASVLLAASAASAQAVTVFHNGVNLTITGTDATEDLLVTYDDSGPKYLIVGIRSTTLTPQGSCVTVMTHVECPAALGIVANLGGGGDEFVLDPEPINPASDEDGYLTAEINGEDGDDLLKGGTENDTINGGPGRDLMFNSKGSDTYNGGTGGDGNGDFVDYAGSAGETQATAAPAGVTATIGGGPGSGSAIDGPVGDTIAGDVENLIGTRLGDRLTGNDSPNRLFGNAGALVPGSAPVSADTADTLSGLGGDDVIVGGQGADTVLGGDGSDQIFGGDDGDVIDGQNGGDLLHGDAGDDSVRGAKGRDSLFGDVGIDKLFARARRRDVDTIINCGPGANRRERATRNRRDPAARSC